MLTPNKYNSIHALLKGTDKGYNPKPYKAMSQSYEIWRQVDLLRVDLVHCMLANLGLAHADRN